LVRLRCPKCGYVWDYRGKKYYATCPNCFRKVNIAKYRVE
jgi:predicted Zn-ribbon and HTH transcriptional regulator